ncbi:hypothetical protein OAJ78_05140 [Gammaproteobacteria bacterium]|nr:hypothetical protein [Gammaproteobacteria bacterium]
MKTITWFTKSLLFSDRYRRAWYYFGVIIFFGCLLATLYWSF